MAKYKKQYIYSEKTHAEQILKKGFPDRVINYQDMYILSKFFHQVEGLGEKRLEKRLITFCLSQSKDFNPILEADTIRKWVLHGMKHVLRDVKKVVITRSEMEKIKEIKDLKHRKILFALLVFAKSAREGRTKIKHHEAKSEKYYVNYSRFPNVIALLDFRITEVKFADALSNFIKTDLLYAYPADKELIRLDFANDKSPMALTIPFPERCMEYYKAYFGGVSGYCVECGKEMIKASNSQIRCENCAREKKKNDNKNIKRKVRNVTK